MYDTLREYYYWPYMAQDKHAYISHCESCRIHRPFDKHQQLLKLFPPSGPLELIAIDILGPLTRTKYGNRLIIVMSDRDTKLARTIPVTKITAPKAAKVVLEDWIIPNGTPEVILTDNDKQFTSKFFAALCASLGSKLVTTTKCHP